MPWNRVPEFPFLLSEWMDAIPRQQRLAPIYLGGTTGSGGGVGQPPGGFIGQLSQQFVAYDTDEFALTSGSDSLVDNLDHIRYWEKPARWFEAHQGTPIQNRVYVEPGIWTHTAGSQPLIFTGTYSPIFTSGSIAHVDVLYLTTSGSLAWSTSATTTPTYPGGTTMPIWEVYIRTSGSTYNTDQGVNNYLFRDVRPFLNTGSATSGSPVTGTGVINRIPYFDSTSSLSSRDQFRLLFDTVGAPVLTIGHSTADLTTLFSARVQIVRDLAAGFTSFSYSDTPTTTGFFTLGHSRGTWASPTALLLGDTIGRININGQYTSGSAGIAPVSARIEAITLEDFTSGSLGTYWSIKTTAAETASLVEGLGIYSDHIKVSGNSLYLDSDAEVDLTGAVTDSAIQFDGNKIIPGNILSSGTYTPTLTDGDNVAGSTSYLARWTRIGNNVEVGGKITLETSLPASNTEIGIELPFVVDFTSEEECSGVAFCPNEFGVGAAILADTTNDRASMAFICASATENDFFFKFSFTIP